MKATMMVHPWEDRPLSVREYLRIQGFPDTWKVVVSVPAAYRLFGEAEGGIPASYEELRRERLGMLEALEVRVRELESIRRAAVV